MILALYKATEYWRDANGFTGFRLVQVVILDQVLYFTVCVFTVGVEISVADFSIQGNSMLTIQHSAIC